MLVYTVSTYLDMTRNLKLSGDEAVDTIDFDVFSLLC